MRGMRFGVAVVAAGLALTGCDGDAKARPASDRPVTRVTSTTNTPAATTTAAPQTVPPATGGTPAGGVSLAGTVPYNGLDGVEGTMTIQSSKIIDQGTSASSCPDHNNQVIVKPRTLTILAEFNLAKPSSNSNPNLSSGGGSFPFNPDVRLVLSHGGDVPDPTKAFIIYRDVASAYDAASEALFIGTDVITPDEHCVIHAANVESYQLTSGTPSLRQLRLMAFLPAGFDLANYRLKAGKGCFSLPALSVVDISDCLIH